MAQNNQALTFDEQGKELDPHPPKINLHDAAAIRRELCAVYRDMRSGRIDPADGTKFIYALDAIRKAHEAEVLGERLELMEFTLKQRKIKK
jgi:hypothetical protein